MKYLFSTLLALFLAKPAYAQLTMNVETNYYDVRGYNIRQLRDYMRNVAKEHTKSHVWSDTTYELKWSYTHVENMRGCGVSRVNLDMKVIQVLPKLHYEVSLDTKDYKRWQVFIKNSNFYQDRHQHMIFRYAKMLQNRIKTVGMASNCYELEEMTNNVAKEVLKELKEERFKFDRETNYGEKVGAHIELDSDFY